VITLAQDLKRHSDNLRPLYSHQENLKERGID
jgi:hypothetical protein